MQTLRLFVVCKYYLASYQNDDAIGSRDRDKILRIPPGIEIRPLKPRH